MSQSVRWVGAGETNLGRSRELHTLRLHPHARRNSKDGRNHLGEGATFPNVLSSLLPSLTRGVCTDLGLGTSLRCIAG